MNKIPKIYTLGTRFKEMVTAPKAEKIKLEAPPVVNLECERCGQRKPDVEHTFCPYDQEIHHKDTPVVMCQECLQRVSEEI